MKFTKKIKKYKYLSTRNTEDVWNSKTVIKMTPDVVDSFMMAEDVKDDKHLVEQLEPGCLIQVNGCFTKIEDWWPFTHQYFENYTLEEIK